jgi:hypothetical protein
VVLKVWCDACKDWTLDNAKHECAWCETKFTKKNLQRAKVNR